MSPPVGTVFAALWAGVGLWLAAIDAVCDSVVGAICVVVSDPAGCWVRWLMWDSVGSSLVVASIFSVVVGVGDWLELPSISVGLMWAPLLLSFRLPLWPRMCVGYSLVGWLRIEPFFVPTWRNWKAWGFLVLVLSASRSSLFSLHFSLLLFWWLFGAF